MKSNETEKLYDSIVFMNAPLSNIKDDVLGVETIVNSIKKASEKSHIIGLIAGFGSGKSSVINTLVNNSNFEPVIYINMWESLSKIKESKEGLDFDVKCLTKDFLFQLASGHSDNLGKYVNRILSNNYRQLSFSIISKKFWLILIITIITFSIYNILKYNDIHSIYVILLYIFPENLNILKLATFLKTFSFFFFALSLISLIYGFSSIMITFAKFKSEKKDVEINEIFEVYSVLNRKLRKNKFKKKRTIVIIEDLDRIDNKDTVVAFLKEIYKFVTSVNDTKFDNPLFIVAIKPECDLFSCDDNEDSLYSKIFDYSINLKPINYVDYENILLNIIGGDESDNMKLLNRVLEDKDKIIGAKLPNSFSWLTRGENLTIRELKERLNRSVSLLVELKNKGYKNQSYVNFATCCSVAYLSSAYPMEFNLIVKNEIKFSNVIQKITEIRHLKVGSNNLNQIVEVIETSELIDFKEDEKNKQLNKKFILDLSNMLANGDIDVDFRMYFYSFPKGSYIMNSDERRISNALLYGDFEEHLTDVPDIVKHIKTKNENENILLDSLNRISQNPNMNFYYVIMFDEYLFISAYIINKTKVVSSLIPVLMWADEKLSEMCLLELSKYNESELVDEFIALYASQLSLMIRNEPYEKVIRIRIKIIEIFGDKLNLFKYLYYSNDSEIEAPIITQAELKKIESRKDAIDLICFHNITTVNDGVSEYILDYISEEVIPEDCLITTIDNVKIIIDNCPKSKVAKALIKFLMINNIVDNHIFTHICQIMDREDKYLISDYISNVDINKFTKEYLFVINDNMIDIDIKPDLIDLLYENKKFNVLLSCLSKCNKLNIINFYDAENVVAIIKAVNFLNTYNDALVPMIRFEIIVQAYKNDNDLKHLLSEYYLELFYEEYTIITKEEVKLFPSNDEMLIYLNKSKIDRDNINCYIECINTLRCDDVLCVTKLLFSDEYDNEYISDEIARDIIIAIDYNNINIKELSEEDRENVLLYVDNYLNVNSIDDAILLTELYKCLIPKLEKTIVNGNEIHKYIDLIEKYGEMSTYTKEWIEVFEVDCELPEILLEYLFNNNLLNKYLVGKVLRDKNFAFPYMKVDNSIVVKEFSVKSCIWDYLSSNTYLIEFIIQNKEYKNHNKNWGIDEYRILYRGRQTADFVIFLFSYIDLQEKEYYLRNMNDIFSAEDSINIAEYLCREENINLLENDEIFEIVKYKLWEDVKNKTGYKSMFTRKRNMMKKSLANDD